MPKQSARGLASYIRIESARGLASYICIESARGLASYNTNPNITL